MFFGRGSRRNLNPREFNKREYWGCWIKKRIARFISAWYGKNNQGISV